MGLLLVNNYVRGADRKIRRYLEAIKLLTDEVVEVVRFHDIEPDVELKGDIKAIILSGSEACLSRPEDRPFFEGEMAFVREASLPILGICFGHQLIGMASGAEVRSMGRVLEEAKYVVVEEPDDIFASWRRGDKLLVAEWHSDEVAELPEGFVLLASSQYCAIEAMRHVELPIYGVQFHPERRPSSEAWDGLYVLYNFLDLSGIAVRRLKPSKRLR